MPTVYRILVTVSGLTFLISGIVLREPYVVWGRFGQAVIITAGVILLLTPWRASWRKNRIAVYSTSIAGFLLIMTAWLLAYSPAKWSAVAVWTALTLYTVGLVAFGWVREPPNADA